MALNIRSEEVNRLAEALARVKRTTKTEAVRLALEGELKRASAALPLRERVRDLQARILSYPPTGDEADKAFFDALSGDE
jgi:antitoxin VapB